MRLIVLLVLAALSRASPAADPWGKHEKDCCEEKCYKRMVYADSHDMGNAKKDCTSYQHTTVTPCPVIETSITTTTVTSTIGVQCRAEPLKDQREQHHKCEPETCKHEQPWYAWHHCWPGEFGAACSCLGVPATTTTLPPRTSTVYSTKTITKTVSKPTTSTQQIGKTTKTAPVFSTSSSTQSQTTSSKTCTSTVTSQTSSSTVPVTTTGSSATTSSTSSSIASTSIASSFTTTSSLTLPVSTAGSSTLTSSATSQTSSSSSQSQTTATSSTSVVASSTPSSLCLVVSNPSSTYQGQYVADRDGYSFTVADDTASSAFTSFVLDEQGHLFETSGMQICAELTFSPGGVDTSSVAVNQGCDVPYAGPLVCVTSLIGRNFVCTATISYQNEPFVFTQFITRNDNAAIVAMESATGSAGTEIELEVVNCPAVISISTTTASTTQTSASIMSSSTVSPPVVQKLQFDNMLDFVLVN